jgi:hypothetical protein
LQKRTLLIAAAVGWILAAVALIIFLSGHAQLEDARRPVAASWLPPSDTDFAAVMSGALTLSPDGSKLAFLTGDASETKLWVRDVTTGTVHQVEVERPTFPSGRPMANTLVFFLRES